MNTLNFIKVSDTHSVARDQYNWILLELIDGHSKQRGDFKREKRSYHANLDQVARAIGNDSVKAAKNIHQMNKRLKATSDEIAKTLETIDEVH